MKVKKILSIFLVMAMVVSLMPGMSLPAKATGASTSLSVVDTTGVYDSTTNPLAVSSSADLAYLAQQVNAGGTITYTDSNGNANTIAANSASYRQTANIVFGYWQDVNGNNVVDDGEIYDAESGGTALTNSNWTPIGNDSSLFAGTYDGNGKTISGLYIKGSNIIQQGLFGRIGSGTVKNLGIENSGIFGALNSFNIGGVVGVLNGTISNCHFTGSIKGASALGGVAGANSGGTVEYCYSMGYILANSRNSSSSASCIGGVVGTNMGTTRYCFNTATVSCLGSSYEVNQVGGVVGINNTVSTLVGSVTNCYNDGAIFGTKYVGGVVGDNFSGSVSNCYSAGAVKASSNVGGVIGHNAGTVISCYYDAQMFPEGGIDGTDYISHAEGKPTSDLTVATAFTGWDDSKWTFTSGLYPRLTGMHETDVAYVSVSPVFLTGSQTVDSVTSNFTVSIANVVSWVSGDTGIVSLSGAAATLAGSGSVTLTASKNGVSKAIELTASYTPTYSVSGTVSLESGFASSVEGLTVTLYSSGAATSYTDLTDASGNFTINGVPNGTYTAVIASASGSYGKSSSASFAVNDANVTSGANITLLAPADCEITNNTEGKFLVNGGAIEYPTLAAALAICTESAADSDNILTIQFGSDATAPLVITKSAYDSTNNCLISATYTGWVTLNDNGENTSGLIINSGVNAIYSGLVIKNAASASKGTIATTVNGGSLDILEGTSITVSTAVSNSYAVVAQLSGTITMSGGTLTSAMTTIGCFSSTLNISGGSILTDAANIINKHGIYNDFGTVNISGSPVITATGGDYTSAIYSIGTLNIYGGTISSNVCAIENNGAQGAITMTGGTVEGTGSGSIALLNRSEASAIISGGEIKQNVVGTGIGSAIYNMGTLTVNGTASVAASGSMSNTAIYNSGSSAKVTVSANAAVSAHKAAIENNATPVDDSVIINGGTIIAGSTSSFGVCVLNVSTGIVKIEDGANLISNGVAVSNAGTLNITGGTLAATTTTSGDAPIAVNNGSGTANISGGTIKSYINNSSSSQNSHCVHNSTGIVNITGGSITAATDSADSITRAAVNSNTGTINISGGTLKSEGTKKGSCAAGYELDSSRGPINISKPSDSASPVLCSKTDSTILLSKFSANDAAQVTLFNTTMYSSTQANVKVAGTYDVAGGYYTINNSNYTDATLSAINTFANYGVAAWTNDAGREASSYISTESSPKIGTLGSPISDKVYLVIADTPGSVATGGSFTDTDGALGKIAGTLSWTASTGTDFTEYKVYWGSDALTILSTYPDAIYTLSGVEQTIPADTTLPSGANYFLVYCCNGSLRASSCLAIAITDTVNVTVLASGSLGAEDDSKITGLASNIKYTVTSGTTTYYVKADGTLSAARADVAELSGTEITGLTNGTTYNVQVYTSFSVLGRVSSGTTGASAAGLTVAIYSRSDLSTVVSSATADANGNFEITDVPNGTYYAVVEASAGSYGQSESNAINVSGANVTTGANITLEVESDYWISGGTTSFKVNGNGDYATLADALAVCTNSGADGNLTIRLGGRGRPLEVSERNNGSSGNFAANVLIPATYSGNVEILNANDVIDGVGLVIGSGSVVFNNLALTSGIQNSGSFYSILTRGGKTLTISSGTFSVTGDYSGCAVNEGTLTINGGTFTSSGTDSYCVDNVNSDNGTGTLTVSGGTFSALGQDSAVINNKGRMSVTGGSFTAGDGTALQAACVKNSAPTIYNSAISGGTFTSNDPSGAGIYNNRVLAISGSTEIVSASMYTILMRPEASTALFGKTVHSPIDAYISIKGAASGSSFKIVPSNFADAALIAPAIHPGKSFGAWTSDSVFANSISTINGDSVSTLTTGANVAVTDIYLKTGADTAVVLATGSLGTAGNGTITGLTSGSKYKMTMGSVVYYAKADGTLSLKSSDAAALTGTEITGLVNGTTYKVEVYTTGGGGDGGGSGDSPAPSNNASVVVDGKTQSAGKSETTTENGKTTTTVTLSTDKLRDILESSSTGATVTIPITAGSNTASGRLDGQAVKDMENKSAILVIKTDTASYTLPASEINIDGVSNEYGASVTLSDIKVSVTISEPSSSMTKVVANAAENGGYTIAVPAVEFTVNCTYNEKTVEVSTFNSYVERLIAIPEGVDPSKITTGIVVEPDGTKHHVPTEIVVIDGKYYAKINSLTNSVYSVIYNPIEFSDVENHWAKDAINNMGSRLVVNGVGNNNYDPDRSITRAEFAAIMVKALGLEPGTGTNSFNDVGKSEWYCEYIETASSYAIIKGYNENTFGPDDLITREQAMTMIARAMKITGLKVSITESEISELLSGYADKANASAYAKESITACLKTGIVSGTSKNTISPEDYVTRAEVAVMVERLLQKSDLI